MVVVVSSLHSRSSSSSLLLAFVTATADNATPHHYYYLKAHRHFPFSLSCGDTPPLPPLSRWAEEVSLMDQCRGALLLHSPRACVDVYVETCVCK